MEPSVLNPGSEFGRYSVVRKIGQGGMGAVYEGVHLELKKKVAIKVLIGSLAERADARARFVREAQAAARIDHPNAVDVSDVGIVNGIPYMVMEFLVGEDMQSLQEREGRLSPERIADIVIPVASALAAAHEEGIVHRDIKPHNIFLARDRHGAINPKLLDFGISKVADDAAAGNLTHTAVMLGTPYYMSPEQVQASKYADARSDQYSLAVVMYQCASGKLPFDEAELYPLLTKISTGGCEPLNVACPDLPRDFCDVVMRGMSVDRKQRYESVIEFARALLPFTGPARRSYWENNLGPGNPTAAIAPHTGETTGLQGSVAGTTNSLSIPLDRGGKNLRWLMAGAGGALVVAAILAAFGMRHGTESAAESATTATPPALAAAPAEPAPAAATAAPGSPAQAAPSVNEISLTVDPPEATIELDGQVVGTGTFHGSLIADDRQHAIRVSAPGYAERTVPFVRSLPVDRVTLVKQGEQPAALAAKRAAPPPKPAPPPPAAKPADPPPAKPTKPTTNNAPIIE